MRRIPVTLALVSALLTGGCELVAIGVATPMIAQQKQVNLTNASYAAAETLGQQAGKRFRHERPLMVEDLQEIIDMNQKKPIANPKVGRVLSAQMRSRFKQLGYNVVDMTPYRGEGSDPGAEVSGTYELINSRMNVFLKMADKRTGEVITIYEYSLPITYDIKKYMTGNANMLPPLWTN